MGIKVLGEGLVIENEARFLRREYEYWQYADYKPQGMNDAIDAIIDAMHSVDDVIKSIEPRENLPIWDDPQPY